MEFRGSSDGIILAPRGYPQATPSGEGNGKRGEVPALKGKGCRELGRGGGITCFGDSRKVPGPAATPQFALGSGAGGGCNLPSGTGGIYLLTPSFFEFLDLPMIEVNPLFSHCSS